MFNGKKTATGLHNHMELDKMKHAIILFCHKDLSQVEEVIDFYDNDFIFYLHIDKKTDISETEISRFRDTHPNVRVFRLYRMHWGGITLLHAELRLIRLIVRSENVDYIHICSGQDHPIKKLRDIKAFFEENRGKQFMEYHQLPYSEWNFGTFWRLEGFQVFDLFDYNSDKGRKAIKFVNRCMTKIGFRRCIPNHFPRLYGGSTWMSLTFDCAKYVVECRGKATRFLRRLRFTFGSDEVFMQTIIMNSRFASTVVNDNKRLTIWIRNDNNPATLTKKHWWSVSTSQCLWAQKFDYTISHELHTLIHKYILSNQKILIAENGAWMHSSFEGYTYDTGFANALVKLVEIIRIKTAFDFGCGPGWYVKLFHDLGVDMQGYDGNPFVEEMSAYFFNNGFYCQQVNLDEELEAEEPVDLVMSLEVGEHIPQDKEQVFLDNLTRNSTSYILLSWAVPEQVGDGHINCRPNEYIIENMRIRGFKLNKPVTIFLRTWAESDWFAKSLMFFERNS